MADKDPAKIAAESYQKATDAYAKNQTVQGMAAAQVADAAVKPAAGGDDAEIQALYAKAAAGKITPIEQKRLDALIAKKNQKMAPPLAPAPTPAAPVAAPAPVQPAAPPVMDDKRRLDIYGKQREGLATEPEKAELAADVAKRKARFAELEAKRQKGTWTPEEQKEYGALLQSALAPAKAGVDIPLPTKEEAQAAIDKAKAEGATGYMDPAASTESLAAGGGPVYRDFEAPAAPAIEAPAVAVTPKAEEKKKSAVDAIIEGMKAETADEKGPNIWDIIQAAAAGWNFQTPAYLERKKTKEQKAAEMEKLSKTAQFEKALQEERLASEAERSRADIASRERIAGIGGIGLPAGATKGQKLGAGFIQGIK